jgi:hypothetical protein
MRTAAPAIMKKTPKEKSFSTVNAMTVPCDYKPAHSRGEGSAAAAPGGDTKRLRLIVTTGTRAASCLIGANGFQLELRAAATAWRSRGLFSGLV